MIRSHGPKCVILYHVTGLCKGPIISLYYDSQHDQFSVDLIAQLEELFTHIVVVMSSDPVEAKLFWIVFSTA